MQQACVHLYTGGGKGKTTAAVGLCVRAAGRGLATGFVQFLKDGTTGELAPLGQLGVWVHSPQGPATFVWQMDEKQREEYAARQAEILGAASEKAGTLDLLVLDEALSAMEAGVLPCKALVKFVSEKPTGLELVLTGRTAPAALEELADYCTEMREKRHPYTQGLPARKGIEY